MHSVLRPNGPGRALCAWCGVTSASPVALERMSWELCREVARVGRSALRSGMYVATVVAALPWVLLRLRAAGVPGALRLQNVVQHRLEEGANEDDSVVKEAVGGDMKGVRDFTDDEFVSFDSVLCEA